MVRRGLAVPARWAGIVPDFGNAAKGGQGFADGISGNSVIQFPSDGAENGLAVIPLVIQKSSGNYVLRNTVEILRDEQPRGLQYRHRRHEDGHKGSTLDRNRGRWDMDAVTGSFTAFRMTRVRRRIVGNEKQPRGLQYGESRHPFGKLHEEGRHGRSAGESRHAGRRLRVQNVRCSFRFLWAGFSTGIYAETRFLAGSG